MHRVLELELEHSITKSNNYNKRDENLGGWMGKQLTQSPLGETCLHTNWHLDASSRLVTTEMGRKLGRGLCPLLRERGWVST